MAIGRIDPLSPIGPVRVHSGDNDAIPLFQPDASARDAVENVVSQSSDLAETDRQILDAWLAEFEQNWSPEHLARCVPDLPGEESPLRRPALIGMVRIDMRRTWQPSKQKHIEKYVKQFPEFRGAAGVPLELMQEELELRKSSGLSSSIVQFLLRFPSQAQEIRRWAELEAGLDPNVTSPLLSKSMPTTTPSATSLPQSQESPSRPVKAAASISPVPPAAPSAVVVSAPKPPAGSPPKPPPPAVAAPPSGPTFAPASFPAAAPTAQPSATGPTRTPSGELTGQFGRYFIERRLGRGGMGTVYLARDVQLDRRVALKIPHFDDHEGAEMPARFKQEARAAAGLLHTNICAVYDVGQCDGVHYLTMAYVDGQPLSDQLRGRKALPPQRAVDLVRRIALALDHAHRQGVIHRDLKPSNIMIDSRGEPVVMDFGLARRDDSQGTRLTVSGQTLGTLSYMPPEQLRGDLRDIGPHSDVYSLGVILYELLTGRLPFDGSPAEIVGKLLTNDPPPMSTYQPALAGSVLNVIVERSMNKLIADRYASMAQFAQALANLSAEAYAPAPPAKTPPPGRETASSPSLSAARRSSRRAQEPPKGAILAIILILAALAIGGLVWKLTQSLRTSNAVDAPIDSKR
jgi:serine/threonine protein kinase